MKEIKSKDRLSTLMEMAQLINSSLDHEEIRKQAIEATKQVLKVEAASLLLCDESTGELYFDVATGEKGAKLKTVRLKRGEGIAGWVAEHGKPLIITDCAADDRFFKGADKTSGFETKNILCTPVCSKGCLIGVLEGINKQEEEISQEDLDLLGTLANYVGVAIENANLYEELKEIFFTTLQVLADTIELRDPYTGGHTRRVHDYSMKIAERLNFSKDRIDSLRLAAILHDIGKIGIKDDILRKPGKLSNEEFAEIEKHCLFAFNVLRPLSAMKDAFPREAVSVWKPHRLVQDMIPGIRSHHEKFNGSGYPDRLQEEAIPIIARIIAISDTFDAMITDRPYRKGLSRETALAELKRNSGTQFDPGLVDIFLTIIQEDPAG